ncbi:MAG: hypothetical protein WD226_09040 [Planctomycetota bacterium]
MNAADHLNPIFLQALRQALRGRMFQVLFWITLVLAMSFSLLYIVIATQAGGEPSGDTYFIWVYAALSFAVHLFVPFSAFLSLGNEWDEDTYELLVLSNLRPRNIVFGKLLSALLQAGLWFSAFGPFLVFSFLMPGLDLFTFGVILLLTALSTAFLTNLALCLSATARGRFARTFLLALLGLFLSGWALLAVVLASETLEHPTDLRSSIGQQAIWGIVTALVVVGGYLFVFACTRLAHEEENRSTGLRVFSSVILVAAWWWATSLYLAIGRIAEVFSAFTLMGVLVLTVFSALYVTEGRGLGRRVELEVPKSRWLALLSTPWLPGGGRGVAWYWLHLGLWLGAVALTLRVWPATSVTSPDATMSRLVVWVGVAYTWIYMAVPAFVFRPWSRRLALRVVARVAMPVFALLSFLVPTMVLFLFTSGGPEVMEHIGNPVEVVDSFDPTLEGFPHRLLREPRAWSLGGIGLALVLLHLPGVVHGVREVLAASRARRA